MKQLLACLLIITSLSACSQTSNQSKNTKHVGGNCEGCEAIYEGSVPFEKLTNTATLPDYNEPGPKLEISGIVYQRDGKSPAKMLCCMSIILIKPGIIHPHPMQRAGESVMAEFVAG